MLLAGTAVIALYFLGMYLALRLGMWIVMSSRFARPFHRGLGRGLNLLTVLKERYERQKP